MRAEGYFETFPEPSFNVAVQPLPRKDGTAGKSELVMKQVLVATKDFKAGEVIYKETPIVAALDADLEGSGRHCSQCFREVAADQAVRPDSDPLNPVYCSEECKDKAAAQHHALLFSAAGASLLQSSTEAPLDADKVAARKAAQQALVDQYKNPGKSGIILVARFIAQMVAEQAKKLAAGAPSTGTEDYTLFDHIERLRYLELKEEEFTKQAELLSNVLKLSAEGLEEFLKDDRYGLLLGKMAYNAIGVSLAEGRDDKPESVLPIEEREWTRTPTGTTRQVGSGLYFVSSYMAHSCAPSVRPTFPEGSNEVHIIANEDINKGDELTMAYVNVTRPEDGDVIEYRRNRRQALARGWRFACACSRCEAEAPVTAAPKADDVQVMGPAAKTEEAVARFESGQSGAEFRAGTSTNNDDVE